MTQYTVAQVAALLGVTIRRVRQVAQERGLGRKIGARLLVFSSREMLDMMGRKTKPGSGRKKGETK